MDVSIGIATFNEERNIARLLRALLLQKATSHRIREIIVVDDCSNDRTREIVRSFSSTDKKIVLLTQKQRKGKAHAVNRIIAHASSPIIILESADTLPASPDTLDSLCSPLNDKNIGIVSGHTLPLNDERTLVGRLIHLHWKVHHRLSAISPKFCELIAFRNCVRSIKITSVDEENIGAVIQSKGYGAFYAKGAVFYNSGPKSILGILSQKRRNHCGHLLLKKRSRYSSSSLRWKNVLLAAQEELSLGNCLDMLLLGAIEIVSRLLGRIDHLRGEEYATWEPLDSTKLLPERLPGNNRVELN